MKSDAVLKQDVDEELAWNPALDPSHIGVIAERAAWSAPGVTDVEGEIALSRP
ncbi:MAG TPA: BON domain-containing protein [Stellaceae bacterium]|jgi:hypothetical protein